MLVIALGSREGVDIPSPGYVLRAQVYHNTSTNLFLLQYKDH